MSPAQRRDLRDGLLFTSPFIFGVLALWVGPMLYSIYLTTQDWNIITPPKFVALRNFTRLLSDPLVRKSLYNTAYLTFIGVPLQLLVAFALALMLNQKIRGLSLYRTVYYIPSITPAVASPSFEMSLPFGKSSSAESTLSFTMGILLGIDCLGHTYNKNAWAPRKDIRILSIDLGRVARCSC